MINNQKADIFTYITRIKDKNEEEVKKGNNPKNSSIRNKSFKTIENSELKKNNNIISIVFPIIKSNHKNSVKNLFPNIQRYTKITKENNKNENIYKSQKKMSVAISKLKKKTKEYYNYNNDNSQSDSSNYSNNSLDNNSKNNSINNSVSNKIIRFDSSKEENKPNIKSIECNLNYDKNNNSKIKNNKSISPKRFNYLFHNDSSSKA